MAIWPQWYNPIGHRMPAARIVDAVALEYGITTDEMCGPARDAVFVDARGVVAMVLKARGHSYPWIGRLLGNRDHKTIMHCCTRFKAHARHKPVMMACYMRLIGGAA